MRLCPNCYSQSAAEILPANAKKKLNSIRPEPETSQLYAAAGI